MMQWKSHRRLVDRDGCGEPDKDPERIEERAYIDTCGKGFNDCGPFEALKDENTFATSQR
jgi:hypothetical protein